MSYAKYWRNSLADADLGRGILSFSDVGKLMSRHISEFLEGVISSEGVDQFFNGEAPDVERVDIIIRPMVFLARMERAKKIGEWTPETVAPIVGFAQIDRKGLIYATGRTYITRDVLEPLDVGSFSIGTTQDLDLFLTEEDKKNFITSEYDLCDEDDIETKSVSASHQVRWKNYLDYCDRLFLSVCPMWPAEDESHILSDHWFLQKNDKSVGVSKSIINLYDHIQKNKPDVPLFETYSEDVSPEIKRTIGEPSFFKERLGHSGDENPLSTAQRDSLSHFLSMDDGDILAVNGPPGTGKTALLLSVVATLWVKAALKQGMPSVIVAASANNQAVTNIIDSFGRDFSRGSKAFEGRWLPDIDSFGSYFPSQGKATEAGKKYQTESFFDWIESRGYTLESESQYIRHAKNAFPDLSINSVEDAVRAIHKTMSDQSLKLSTIDSTWRLIPKLDGEINELCNGNHNLFINNKKSEIKDIELKISDKKEFILNLKSKIEHENKSILLINESIKINNSLMSNVNSLILLKKDELHNFNKYLVELKLVFSKWSTYLSKESIWYEFFDKIDSIKRKRILLAKTYLHEIYPDFPVNNKFKSVESIGKAIKNRINKLPHLIKIKTAEIISEENNSVELRKKIDSLIKISERSKLIISTVSKELIENEALVNDLVSNLDRGRGLIKKFDGLVTDISCARNEWKQICSDFRIDSGLYFESQEDFDLEEIDSLSDKVIRFKLFNLASHYWEGRWLLESAKLIKNKGDFTKDATEHRWRCRMMITPCMVGTFFVVPRLMQYSSRGRTSYQDNYLYNFIDLLVVDEAGQVLPEVAGATFALSKKALVIGDSFQIEPIWSIPSAIDIGNLINAGLLDEERVDSDYSIIQASGKSAATGSVMTIAQGASRYHYDPDLSRGMYLYEHRRCYDEIISFCNDLCYRKKLIPMRGLKPKVENHGGFNVSSKLVKPINPYLRNQAKEQKFNQNNIFDLPAMGYLHIEGECERSRSVSRVNLIDAERIARWIHENRSDLEERYDLPLNQVLGVVTPFKRQAHAISQALRLLGIKAGQGEGDVTVGTIHSFQGSERSVIIFSSTYTLDSDGDFIDANESMLNVAVSRARDSFLVFGDVRMFPKGDVSTPRGLLGSYLFKQAENDLSLSLS